MKTDPTIKSRINRFFEHEPTFQEDSSNPINSWTQYLQTGGNWCCGISLIQSILEIDRLTRIENEKTKYKMNGKRTTRKWFPQHGFSWLT